MTIQRNRRQFIIGAGAVMASAALAGCNGDDDAAPADDDGDDGDDGNGEVDVDSWLDDAPNYDGSTEDLTGEDTVTVENGDPDGGGQFKFSPAAIEVDAGTTVVWEWVDQDGHSVTHENGDDFDSGTEQGEGTEFEHTFDEAGTYLYYCQPHRALGQKGAVIVQE